MWSEKGSEHVDNRGSSTIPLKDQLEYSHGNYHKAIKLLIMCAKLLENQRKWCHLDSGTISVVYITNWERPVDSFIFQEGSLE